MLKSILFRLFFLVFFVLSAYYIFYVQTEKYESKSIIMIKDISRGQSISPFGSLLSGSISKSMQDAKLLEVFIKSSEMFNLLDEKYNLTAYYKSTKIDVLNRLSDKSTLPLFELNKRNLMLNYQEDLNIVYDEPSSTLSIGFAHANAKIAQKIVESIIEHASKTLNIFEKKSSEIILQFLKKQELEKYKLFITSIKELLAYQSKHKTFDPKIDMESKSAILAGLESQRVQKEVEYESKLQYMNSNSTEIRLDRNSIEKIKNNIEKIKDEISGAKGKKELNVNVSEFELLKSKVEFNKKIYSQILIKLEETNVMVRQNAKNLIVVVKPNIADSYSYPNKIKNIFSIFIIMFFLYGILSMIIKLIKDHKD